MLTPEQWKKIETELHCPWGTVKLCVDGYELTLQVHAIAPLRYGILPYVNGWNRGAWLLKKNEAGEWHDEARRFLPLKKLFLYSRTKLMKMKLPKKTMEEWASKYVETRGLYWTSFAALKRHLIANNKSIDLVEEK